MARKFTAEEMREMATEADVIEVADQFYGHDMDTIAAMLRQAADDLEREEREKKYEYGVLPCGINFVYQTREEAEHKQAILEPLLNFKYPIVRREVGEWKEVE